MWDCYLLDLNYLASDLVTGKSLPILVAVSTFNLDPNLMGVMVIAGVSLGAITTLLQAHHAPSLLTNWLLRGLNHAFAVLLSMAFAIRLCQAMHPDGRALSLLPLFCVALQQVPERPSTPFTLLVLSIALFWAGILYEFDFSTAHPVEAEVRQRRLMQERSLMQQRRLMALNHQNPHHHPTHHSDYQPAVTRSIPHSALYSLVVLLLAFYASAQHGPVACLADAQPTSRRRYMSAAFLANRYYAVWPTLSAALLRAYVYLRTGWLHGNPMHISMGDTGNVSLFCAWLHLVALLYSAAWGVTQLSEQVLTLWPGDHRPRAAAALLALAYLFRWRDPWAGFLATLAIGALSLAVVGWDLVTKKGSA
jgi:hypothetical protein